MSGCDSECPIVLMIYFACWKGGGGCKLRYFNQIGVFVKGFCFHTS